MEILPVSTSNSTAILCFKLEICQGGSSKFNLPDHRYKHRCCSPVPAKSDSLPHAHTQAFNVNHSTSRLLILNFLIVKELKMKDLKYSKSKDEGSRSRSQSMKEQSHYKQEKMKTRPKKAKLKSQITSSTLREIKVKSRYPPTRISPVKQKGQR
ncbi:hypothetical protein Tco_1470714 [Tanacetum coccineum]